MLDVAGRALRTEHVSGAGAHPIEFHRLGELAPGLYFVRAKSTFGTTSRRVAISR